MNKINLLDFLHKVKNIHTYDYIVCNSNLVNCLDFMDIDCDFFKEIDYGIIYLKEFTQVQHFVVDGLERLLSLSLLLHAICECYKKTTERNKKAIETIRNKYLLNKNQTKLRLNQKIQPIYDKIIYGERLTGKEKEHPIFILLHKMWTKIKEDELKASEIFNMLQKLSINIIYIKDVEPREIYYSLNKSNVELNQLLLIEDYLKVKRVANIWEEINSIFDNKSSDIREFLKDFIKNKFNYYKFNENYLYEYFKNYFETISMYKSAEEVMLNLKKSALLYFDLKNINISNDNIKKILIKIKMLDESDVMSFIHSVYEDYTDGIISESTLIEILKTIEEYLRNRKINPNNVTFDELIRYLNAFIACK